MMQLLSVFKCMIWTHNATVVTFTSVFNVMVATFSSVKLDSFNCTNLYTIFIAGKKCAPQALADRVFAIVNKLM